METLHTRTQLEDEENKTYRQKLFAYYKRLFEKFFITSKSVEWKHKKTFGFSASSFKI